MGHTTKLRKKFNISNHIIRVAKAISSKKGELSTPDQEWEMIQQKKLTFFLDKIVV